MAYAHIGHDSVIGNHCILVNNTALAGHVHVGDWAILSGFTLVHQYCHIGAHAFPAWARRSARTFRRSSPYSAARPKPAA
jgi:acyl-[acyl carrier protein]--UDP-N-acetylglucosamine O-acyltransferase